MPEGEELHQFIDGVDDKEAKPLLRTLIGVEVAECGDETVGEALSCMRDIRQRMSANHGWVM